MLASCPLSITLALHILPQRPTPGRRRLKCLTSPCCGITHPSSPPTDHLTLNSSQQIGGKETACSASDRLSRLCAARLGSPISTKKIPRDLHNRPFRVHAVTATARDGNFVQHLMFRARETSSRLPRDSTFYLLLRVCSVGYNARRGWGGPSAGRDSTSSNGVAGLDLSSHLPMPSTRPFLYA